MANYITTPIDPQGKLGIQMPFIVLLIKNVNEYLSLAQEIFLV